MDMHVTYNKAPLVELVALAQWPVQALASVPPIVTGQSAAFDLWFQRLTQTLREQGFHELERLSPHDMPPIAGRPLFRYRRSNESFPIVQFGHGVFTVNAGPPSYYDWQRFRPQVEAALEALVSAKPEELALDAFSRASLRYIDLFDDELRAGLSNFAFMRDDLGVTIALPDLLLDLSDDPDQINPTLALRLPVRDDQGATLSFQVAAGRLGDRQTFDTILDITYAVERTLALTPEAVLNSLDIGYNTIHHWFETLTARFRDRMEPSH
jgi:uncharacterized protein (TIGR04255 family)